jgi:hypothetical protein
MKKIVSLLAFAGAINLASPLRADEAAVRADVIKVFGATGETIVAIKKLRKNMRTAQVGKLFPGMKTEKYPEVGIYGVYKLKNNAAIDTYKFVFIQGKLDSVKIYFKRELDLAAIQKIVNPVLVAKWGEMTPENNNPQNNSFAWGTADYSSVMLLIENPGESFSLQPLTLP